VALPFIVRAWDELPKALVEPACSVPALTVVEPVLVFVPESWVVPVPD
jgi:hypothetical protein